MRERQAAGGRREERRGYLIWVRTSSGELNLLSLTAFERLDDARAYLETSQVLLAETEIRWETDIPARAGASSREWLRQREQNRERFGPPARAAECDDDDGEEAAQG